MKSIWWDKGLETNRVNVNSFEESKLKVLITRLSTYSNVKESFTHSLIYSLLAQNSKIYPDLAFLPNQQESNLMEKQNLEWFHGTQSRKNANSFDVIAISNSVIQELINIPHFYNKSLIPLSRVERMYDEKIPLIILGGANALYTSAFWGENSPFDIIFIGESKTDIKKIFDKILELKLAGKNKFEIINELSTVDGVLIPNEKHISNESFFVATKIIPDIVNETNLEEHKLRPIPFDKPFEASIEISYGCRGFCSFCAENWSRKPYKEKPLELILKDAIAIKENYGANSIDLFSFNFNMHSQIGKILLELYKIFKNIGLKSQRFDALDPLLPIFKIIGKSQISCGLEGISPRLRKFLNKNLDSQKTLSTINLIFKEKFRELKIFLLATGEETLEDFNSFNDFLGTLNKNPARSTRVIFSITPLVKFPFTPLGLSQAIDSVKIETIAKKMVGMIERNGFEGRLAMECHEHFISQSIVNPIYENLQEILFETVLENNFIYNGSISEKFSKSFQDKLKAKGIPTTAPHISKVKTKVPHETLIKAYSLNKNFEELPFDYSKIFKTVKLPRAEEFTKVLQSKQIQTYNFYVTLNENSLGLTRQYIAAILARATMKSQIQKDSGPSSEIVKSFHDFSKSIIIKNLELPAYLAGFEIFELQFNINECKNLITKIDFEKANQEFKNFGSLDKITSADEEVISPEESILNSKIVFTDIRNFSPDKFFNSRGMKFTFVKKENKSEYQFSKDGLKKKFIKSCIVEIYNSRQDLIIEPLAKYDHNEFCDNVFTDNSEISATLYKL